MRESVIYQELWEEARQEAREELRQELREELHQELRLEEARALVLRQLTRKVGEVPATTQSQIAALQLTQLEDLAEALLSFSTLADLSQWLEQLPR